MPFLIPTVTGSIVSQMISKGIKGKNNITIAESVATACSIHFLSPATISLILNGTAAGPGSYISTPIAGISSTGMTGLMMAKAVSLGFKGTSMKDLFDSISQGIFLNLPSLIVTGVAIGVGIGVGTGRITGFNQTVLEGLLLTQFVSRDVLGKDNKNLASIISTGIVNHILVSSIVNVTVVGSIVPPPTGPIPISGVPATANFV